MEAQSIYYALAIVLVLIGIAGTILPALPGLPLVFAGMLLAAWAGDFQQIGLPTVVLLGILTAISLLIDFWATAMGAKRVGASRKAVIGAIAGTVVGIFFGPIGLFVGPFGGAVLGELLHGRRLDAGGIGNATRIGLGTWLGIVFGVALKLMLALAMLGLFAWSWWR
ncbi:DUF456 domain-containing protein [Luteimonas vadosa]|uniref:DUF456 domain-containing protein n=1 Tax=Luteimonas vadosa TaxID=1165507 RepID=A0ABP9E6N2_9GAMM